MISKETFKIYGFAFQVASLIKCVPFQWDERKKRFAKSRLQFYLSLINTVFDISLYLAGAVPFLQNATAGPMTSVTLLLVLYLIALTTSTTLKLLVYQFQDEFVTCANKAFQLNDALGTRN